MQKLKGYFRATGNLLTFAFEPKLDRFDGYFVRQKDITTMTDEPYTHADAELLLQYFKQEFVQEFMHICRVNATQHKNGVLRLQSADEFFYVQRANALPLPLPLEALSFKGQHKIFINQPNEKPAA